MVNAKAKGYRTVRLGRDILHKDGYITDTTEKTSKFVKIKDLFGLWDLIAIRSQEGGAVIRFIQFKTNRSGQKWKEPYKKFAFDYRSPRVSFEIWNHWDRKGFEVEVL